MGTLDAQSHILFRLALYGQQNDFLKRYGDSGEDEFDGRTGTIPQRLLLMNGVLVRDKIKESPFNASTRIAWMAPDNPRGGDGVPRRTDARPTPAEEAHFEAEMADEHQTRPQRVEDLFWALINSTEFSWNH